MPIKNFYLTWHHTVQDVVSPFSTPLSHLKTNVKPFEDTKHVRYNEEGAWRLESADATHWPSSWPLPRRFFRTAFLNHRLIREHKLSCSVKIWITASFKVKSNATLYLSSNTLSTQKFTMRYRYRHIYRLFVCQDENENEPENESFVRSG